MVDVARYGRGSPGRGASNAFWIQIDMRNIESVMNLLGAAFDPGDPQIL